MFRIKAGHGRSNVNILIYLIVQIRICQHKSTKNIIKNRLSMNKWGNYAYYDIRAYKRK